MSKEHYETVTYWYGLPAPSLIKTDELNVGNDRSERTHNYVSPQASDVQTIVSRYEWGMDYMPAQVHGLDLSKYPDYLYGMETFPEHVQNGRYTRGSSEFTVRLNPDNHGAMIRRTLDYSFPNQKAEVYVADEGSEDWRYVGVWYLAGSNTFLRSFPKDELGERLYIVKTSNRRFRDDEFLIPAKFTQGKSSLRIKVRHVAEDRDLYPGMPFPNKNAWSELRYQVFSYVMPDFKI